MTKEQQDLAWACLPKEARDRIKIVYKYQCQNIEYNRGFNDALEVVFGSHNLTSDTEPIELLFVERKRVQKLHDDFIRDEWYERAACLDELFGDKCLPDKEPSVQVEPKLKVGDKVLCKVHEIDIESICTILSYNPKAKEYKLLCGNATIVYRKEDSLKPYIEKEYKFNKGDKVRVIYGKYKTMTGIIKEYSEDDDTWAVILNGLSYPINFAEEWIEPYTEPENPNMVKSPQLNKDNMEEKELNLCELLKDAIGEEIYSPTFGVVKVSMANCNCIGVDPWNHNSKSFQTDGRYVDKADAVISLFPSKALYEKYPLDPYSAWMEWKEARKPKRWTPRWSEVLVY